ncbi:MAG: ferrochelatase [Deltaproteobacteria bacterium]|nr:ferrochelatase [Deltaproteobacteria bacterium]
MKARAAIKSGVLMAQLGTPASVEVTDVRSYLREFLSDPYMVRANRLVWKLVLHFLVLPRYAKKSAARYRLIWTSQGSPLQVISAAQAQNIAERLRFSDEVPVAYGMRYGQPSLEEGVRALLAAECRRVLLFPLFPQYSSAINPSVEEVVADAVKACDKEVELKVAKPFYDSPAYIDALAQSLNEFLASLPDQPQALVLSYHSLPEAFVRNRDPYCSMCAQTTALLLPRLDFPADQVRHCYQSRFGFAKWIGPYTDHTIKSLAASGVRRIAVACPGFVADCIESLYELGVGAREMFLQAGGRTFDLAPCFNLHVSWLDALEAMIRAELELEMYV